MQRTLLILAAVIIALSGCTHLDRKHDVQPEPDGLRTLHLMVGGLPIDDVLDRGNYAGEKIRDEALGQLGREGVPVDDPEELRALLDSLESSDVYKGGDDVALRSTGVPAPLRGFAGLFVAQFLRAAVFGEVEEIHGQVTRYYYNNYTGGGYLEVKTVGTRFDASGAQVAKTRYFWAISVRPDGFTVHKRDDDGDPNDVFPGTDVQISLSNTQGPGFDLDHKLYAKGADNPSDPDRNIVVLGVYQNGTLLPQMDARYDITPESCIDFLFEGYPPEDGLPGQTPSCLGRCSTPAIVGTY